MHRRDMLKAGAVAAGAAMAGAALPAGAGRRGFLAAHHLPIGVQLYALQPDLEADFDHTLHQIAAIGYRTVETAGLYGRTAAQFRTGLNGAGLRCRSMHVRGEPLAPSDTVTLSTGLEAIAADAHALGAQTIVMPLFLMPQGFVPPAGGDILTVLRAAGAALSVDDYKRMAAFLNDKGRRLRSQGLRMAYHNHNFEFAPHGDTNGLGILLAETNPALVSFELDVGWAAAAGADVPALLKRHRGRFRQVHVKDILASTRPNFDLRQDPTEVGRGIIDWKAILPIAVATGVTDVFIEQEPPFTGKRIDAAAISYRYLASI